MSLSHDEETWHEVYENMAKDDQAMIDEAYDATVAALEKWDDTFCKAGDDRAESLIAAITKYYTETKEDL